MDNITEEIKSRLDIVDVISEYIHLTPAGANFKALCPFHSEKTPSFMVSPERQIWHCFGCNLGGDIFSFVMKIEGVEFPEALRILADKANVTLKHVDPKFKNQKTKLLDISQVAAGFFYETLLRSKEAEAAREYLKKRGITSEIAKEFTLGYSIDSWDGLLKYLTKKGYETRDIFLAGLIVKKQSAISPEAQQVGYGAGDQQSAINYYDRFRGRIMFPIKNVHGDVIGFGARSLPRPRGTTRINKKTQKNADIEVPKYINSPETLIYNKSRVLYNLDKAKFEIRRKDLAIVVEGYMDVLASWRVGVKNVVASSGTALTKEQVELIKRYSENLSLGFDMDLAGNTALRRGIDVALGEGMNIRVIELPCDKKGRFLAKDPDECIKRNPEDWKKVARSARPFMEYYFEKVLAGKDWTKLEVKEEIAKILVNQISKLSDKLAQNYWIKRLAEAIDVEEKVLREKLQNTLRGKFFLPQEEEKTMLIPEKRMSYLLAERILAIALKFGENLEYVIQNLSPEVIKDSEFEKLYRNLIMYYTKKGFFDYSRFRKILEKKDVKLQEKADELLLLAEKDFLDFDKNSIRDEVKKNIKVLHEDFILRERKKIEREMKEAERNKDEAKMEKLIKKFNDFIIHA